MEAFHINSTLPFYLNNKNKEYFLEDFEILSTILSALSWRKYNGSIKMITDEKGAEFYEKNGLTYLWDNGIDVNILKNTKENINYKSFWASGKILALKHQKTPVFMMDTDFIVWNDIKNLITDLNGVIAIHRETLDKLIYPDKEHLLIPFDYKFDSDWDFTELPCNTAFVYFGNEKFKDYYVDESIKFMHNNLNTAKDNVSQMVFAEQRIISMCAKKMNIKIKTFEEILNTDIKNQNYFTHLWGFKKEMIEDFTKRKYFCVKAIKRIIKDFPFYENIIFNIESIKKYADYKSILNS